MKKNYFYLSLVFTFLLGYPTVVIPSDSQDDLASVYGGSSPCVISEGLGDGSVVFRVVSSDFEQALRKAQERGDFGLTPDQIDDLNKRDQMGMAS